jgi:hypothetical protein
MQGVCGHDRTLRVLPGQRFLTESVRTMHALARAPRSVAASAPSAAASAGAAQSTDASPATASAATAPTRALPGRIRLDWMFRALAASPRAAGQCQLSSCSGGQKGVKSSPTTSPAPAATAPTRALPGNSRSCLEAAWKLSRSCLEAALELPLRRRVKSLQQRRLHVLCQVGLDWIGLDWIGLDLQGAGRQP